MSILDACMIVVAACCLSLTLFVWSSAKRRGD